jgi:hypothetical protein
MSLFMDVHNIEGGVSASDVAKAHQRDLETQCGYGVSYLRYWVDEEDGMIFCLVEAKTAEDADAVHWAAHGLVADAIYPVVDDRDPLPSEAIQPRSSDGRRGMVASASLLAAAILFGAGFVVSEAVNGGEPPPEVAVVAEPDGQTLAAAVLPAFDRFEKSPRNQEPDGETLAADLSDDIQPDGFIRGHLR